MTKLTEKSAQILAELRRISEGGVETDAQGNQWRDVYLDNAFAFGLTRSAFAGHLSALEGAGLYRKYGDDCFGKVRIND